MRINEFLNREPVALQESDTLFKAAQVFLEHGIDGAPVVNAAEEIVGILTKTHLYRAIIKKIPFESAVSTLMKRNVRTILHDRPVEDAWQMALDYNVSRLPVVDYSNRLVAMMTRMDMANAFESLYQETDAIINSSYDGILVVDEEGNTLKFNSAFHDLVAGTAGPQQCKPVPLDELLYKSGLKLPIVQVSRQAVQSKSPVTLVQRLEEGKEIIITANPVYSRETGKTSRVVVNCRDISSLTDLKRQLQASRELTGVYQSELEKLKSRDLGHTFVCGNQSMRNCFDLAIRVARVDTTILIQGESGVGKEIVARLVHKMSHRSDAPFIRINCGAIPENLLESELFGYDRGAFTGARREGKPGLIELAQTGTLFLDEVSELPLHLQVKLLTVIQEREVARVGGTKPVKVNLRLVAATNRDLSAMVKSGQFRDDLYYRLNVIPITVPPLRDRSDEITLFISHFLRKFNEKYHMTKSIAAEAMDVLGAYDWPGNVRELENLIERMLVVTPHNIIAVKDLPGNIISRSRAFRDGDYHAAPEKEILRELYGRLRSTRKVAEVLGVNQSTVVRKMKKHGLNTAEG
ncbi:MAG TPA: transcriptional regulator [Desulfotomaculum sp.]|nr:transcriptional regulator [Desulfotomaculum sp.]